MNDIRTDLSNKVEELEKRLEEAVNEISRLKKNYENHAHTGYDTSLKIANLDLTGVTSLTLGDTVYLSQGNVSNSIAPVFKIGGGKPVPVRNNVDSFSGSLHLADLYSNGTNQIYTLKNALAHSEIGIAGANPESSTDWITQVAIGADIYDQQKGEVSSSDYNKFAQIFLTARRPDVSSYFTGYQGPITSGNSSVTSGGNTLTDTSRSWGTNEFQGCHIMVINSSNASYVAKISSNTSTTITIDGSWPWSDNVSYTAFNPIVLGAAFFPWKGLRLGVDAEIRGTNNTLTITNVHDIKLANLSSNPTSGSVGEICVVNGVLKICTSTSPLTWTVVGTQT